MNKRDVLYVFAGLGIFLGLLITHTLITKYYFVNFDPTETHYEIVFNLYYSVFNAFLPSLVVAILVKKQGLIIGAIIGILGGIVIVLFESLGVSSFYGSNKSFAIANVITSYIVISILSGGVGELISNRSSRKL